MQNRFNLPNRFGNGQPLPDPTAGAIDGNGFNNYSAGKKVYGGGRPMPNIGPVSDLSGYAERDNAARARKAAIERRLGGQMTGDPNNMNYNNYLFGGMNRGNRI